VESASLLGNAMMVSGGGLINFATERA